MAGGIHSLRRTAAGVLIGLACLPGCGSKPPAAGQPAPRPAPRPATQSNPAPSKDDASPVAAAPSSPSQEAPSGKPPAVPLSADPPPQPVLRPDDARPVHDDRQLAEAGIRLFQSQRLKLYTDIDPQIAQTLPPVIDQAFDALVEYFGPLPPDKARSEFQMTGYLIKDDALFREAGLIPGDLPPFEHGRHRRNEFWMREQKFDYYRRHLLIHEVTHCFMTVMPDVDAPVWYMEGMAECFGTHRIGADGAIQFRVMPTSPEDFAGSGRITAIRNDYAEGKARGITQILDLRPEEFLKTGHYAWSWALCTFFDTHPRYRDRFRQMGGYLQRNAFPTRFYRTFNPDSRDIATEWTLFVQNLQYGYDTARAAIEFQPGKELAGEQSHGIRIRADRGWQSSGVLMQAGRQYRIQAAGRYELANQPRPWISEPQGISFRYFNGAPLGLLLGSLRAETGETGGAGESMLTVFPIGRGGIFTAPASGTLYLRLNDDWSALHDNRGEAQVEIQPALETAAPASSQ